MTTTETRPIITTAQQHLKAKKFDAAVGVLSVHLQREPADVEALNLLGLAYFQLKRFADAKAAYLEMWTVDPTDYRAMFGTGMALQKLGEFDDAEYWFHATLTVNPDFERAATRLSQLAAERAVAQPRESARVTASGGSARTKPLNTLSLPDNEEDIAAYERSSRVRARIDTMNQHWYGIPWPIRVIQVTGIVVIFYFLIQGFLTGPM